MTRCTSCPDGTSEVVDNVMTAQINVRSFVFYGGEREKKLELCEVTLAVLVRHTITDFALEF